MKRVKSFAPASIANVGPAFDILGFAIEGLGDEVEAEILYENKIEIEIVGDNGKLPKDNRNTCYFAANEVKKLLGEKRGLKLKLFKNLPLGSGLGSSSASSVAGAWAANLIFGEKLEKKDLIKILGKAEELACGSVHYDNVAPSLFGDFTLINLKEDEEIIRIKSKFDPSILIISPEIEVKTKDARDVLPKEISFERSTLNSGNIACLISSIYEGNLELFASSLNNNDIIENTRGKLIPGFQEVKKELLNAGALGVTISGSGPAIFTVCESKDISEKAGEIAKEIFAKKGVNSKIHISKIDRKGVRKIK